MARRAIWKGAISFGMVAIPIKLYTATESKDLSFATLHSVCNTRLKHKRWCLHHEAEVEQGEVSRAYEYAKDQYVVLGDRDFENVPVSSTHTIEIVQFVDLTSIDPINFDRTYVIEPEGVGTKPFYLLKQSLENSQRVAIAKVSLRQKEHTCCLRPYEHGIAMHTMHYPDEIRGTRELDLPEEQTAITEPEMAMATMLIDQLTRPYDSSEFQDEYRLALEKVIEAKLSSDDPIAAAPTPAKGKVTDLMEALKASIAATKQEVASPPEAPVAAEDTAEQEAEAAPVARKRKRKTSKASSA